MMKLEMNLLCIMHAKLRKCSSEAYYHCRLKLIFTTVNQWNWTWMAPLPLPVVEASSSSQVSSAAAADPFQADRGVLNDMINSNDQQFICFITTTVSPSTVHHQLLI